MSLSTYHKGKRRPSNGVLDVPYYQFFSGKGKKKWGVKFWGHAYLCVGYDSFGWKGVPLMDVVCSGFFDVSFWFCPAPLGTVCWRGCSARPWGVCHAAPSWSRTPLRSSRTTPRRSAPSKTPRGSTAWGRRNRRYVTYPVPEPNIHVVFFMRLLIHGIWRGIKGKIRMSVSDF